MSVSARIDEALAAALTPLQQRMDAIDPRVGYLAGHLVGFVLGGGKRLRPRFALAGWLATTDATDAPGADAPEPPDAVVTACAALELVQACALLHDDIIDASDTRRGDPTVHRTVESGHRDAGWAGDSARYGVSQTILLGDLALSWADEILATSSLDDAALARTRRPWAAMKSEVLGGQMLDVLAENSGAVDEQTPMRVNRYKTAAYTVERPLHLGAAIAGGSEEQIEALRGFGVDVGIAFQLRDDVLGVFGEPSVTGKPSGDDLREGKRTLLLARAMRLAAPADADFLAGLLGRESTEDELTRGREILTASGALESIEQTIDEHFDRALRTLDDAGLTPAGRDALADLARAATRRTV